MRKTSAIGEYILRLCEEQHLSMRNASIRAGLGSETIGMIIRRGNTTRPRPDTLRLIADALGGDYTHMLRLAGHLPPDDGRPPAALLRHFERAAEALSRLPEDLQIQFAGAILVQAEAARAIYEARSRYEPETEQIEEKDIAAPS